MAATISIKVEFSGGLELLFDNKRSHKLSLSPIVPLNNDTKKDLVVAEGEGKPTDVAYLIAYLRDHLLQERAELFEEGGTVYVSPPSVTLSVIPLSFRLFTYTYLHRTPG